MSQEARNVLSSKGIDPDSETECPRCDAVLTQEVLYDQVNNLPSGPACTMCHTEFKEEEE